MTVEPWNGVIEEDERRRSARILIVDDEEANVRVLDRMLQQAGYTNLEGVTDPRQVVLLLEGFDPDLILLDLLMPHVDGFAVLQEVRSRKPVGADLPVLVLTADVTTEAKRRSLAAGADDFLTKPFDQVEVLLRIRNLLDVHFLHGELANQNAMLEAAVRERTAELRDTIDDLRKVDGERRRLLSGLVQAQEEERRRIAGDIHDDSVQKMTAVGMRLDTLRRRLTDEQHVEALDRLADTVRDSITSLRRLLFELRSPVLDCEGLAAALREQLDRMPQEIQARLDNRLVGEPSVEARAILYRIAQEALANVRKHAKAGTVDVLLDQRDGGFLVRVRDDGAGFSPQDVDGSRPGHLGLSTMRERAEVAGGWCRVQSAPGEGTTVESWVPSTDV